MNPLGHLSRDELAVQVSQFCHQHDLVEKEEFFQKGALVAQSPQDWENIPELTDDDKYWLRREVTRKLFLPDRMEREVALTIVPVRPMALAQAPLLHHRRVFSWFRRAVRAPIRHSALQMGS